MDVEIYQGETLVNVISMNADKGYNEFNFDVSFSKKGLKNYEKANKEAKVKAAANDVYYLPKGKYVVKIGDAKSVFEIK